MCFFFPTSHAADFKPNDMSYGHSCLEGQAICPTFSNNESPWIYPSNQLHHLWIWPYNSSTWSFRMLHSYMPSWTYLYSYAITTWVSKCIALSLSSRKVLNYLEAYDITQPRVTKEELDQYECLWTRTMSTPQHSDQTSSLQWPVPAIILHPTTPHDSLSPGWTLLGREPYGV